MPTLAARPPSTAWSGRFGSGAPAAPPSRAWGLGVTVGAHLLLLALLLFRHSAEPSSGPTASALVVPVALVAAAPPTPAPDLPIPQPPARPAMPPLEPPPLAPQSAAAAPPPVQQAPTAITEAATPPASSAAPSVPAEAAPAAPVLPVSTKAAAPLEAPAVSSTRTTGQATWETQVLAHLERMKRYPAVARLRRQEDVVYVRFTVDRQGAVSGGRIVRSQGFALLDEEVLNLLKRAAPLPPMPADLPGDRVEIMVPVEFFMRGGSP